MLTPKISGIFDCRKYDQSGKKAHDQREMLADTDNVTFSALFPIGQVPEVFMKDGKLDEFARPKSSKREREAAARENRAAIEDVVNAKFKIGANCKWFDRFGKPMTRPTNAELEATRWDVQIDFAKKDKDTSNPLKPSGYWVNAIMVRPQEQNPFSGQEFDRQEIDDEPEPEPTPAEKKEANNDLPFDL